MKYILEWYDTRGNNLQVRLKNKNEVISELLVLATRTDVEEIDLSVLV